MKILAQFLMVALCAGGIATASTTYNFASGANYDSMTALTAFSGLTITAFYTPNISTTLAAANVMNYNGAGLGICNSAVGDNSCGSPEHQIDNNGQYEFMLFKFSTPVSLSTIKLVNYGGTNDRDMTYYTSSSSASSITLGSLASLGNGFSPATTVLCASTCTGTTTENTLIGNSITYLLIGAAGPGMADANADYFKIENLVVNTATPEPSTLSSGLLVIAGLGLMGFRRRKSRKN